MKTRKIGLGVVLGAALLIGPSLPTQAATVAGDIPTGWTGQGDFGSGTADGDVGAAPTVSGGYTYVSTRNGLFDVGGLQGVGGTGTPQSGSTLTTSLFSAAAGNVLQFFFNYVTSDGAGFADYAWARLLDEAGVQVSLLFTARTTTPPTSSVPGFSMPAPAATLTPASVSILDGASEWSALGLDSGTCFAPGCGSTDWVQSIYAIEAAGNYRLQFGVVNWDDNLFDSGMAVAGASIDGLAIDTGGSSSTPNPIPLPAAGWLILAALASLMAVGRKTKRQTLQTA